MPRKSRASKVGGQPLAGPFGERLDAVVAVQEGAQVVVDLLPDRFEDQVAAVGAVEDPLAVAVDPLPLLVHHLVVFQQVLAALEVALFDLLLGRLDPPRDHAALDGLAFLHAQRFRIFLTHSPAKIRIRSSSSER